MACADGSVQDQKSEVLPEPSWQITYVQSRRITATHLRAGLCPQLSLCHMTVQMHPASSAEGAGAVPERVDLVMSQAARTLLTLDEKETKRLFEGEALLRRMYKYGLLDESQSKLDYVLAMTPQDFLERRLQTLVFKLGLAKSMHHARVLIRQRHIRCALIH